MGFVVDGELKATYNHFDSYPDGLGLDILKWLHSLNEDTLPEARQRAKELVLVKANDEPTPAQVSQLGQYADTSVGSQGVNNTVVHDWYQLLRRTQGDPEAALEAGYMIDSADFAYDSLFCEYGYIVDFDEGVFESYIGFRNEPATEGRWAGKDPAHPEYRTSDVYYPIQRTGSWSLFGGLPTQDEFLNALTEGEDEDD